MSREDASCEEEEGIEGGRKNRREEGNSRKLMEEGHYCAWLGDQNPGKNSRDPESRIK